MTFSAIWCRALRRRDSLGAGLTKKRSRAAKEFVCGLHAVSSCKIYVWAPRSAERRKHCAHSRLGPRLSDRLFNHAYCRPTGMAHITLCCPLSWGQNRRFSAITLCFLSHQLVAFPARRTFFLLSDGIYTFYEWFGSFYSVRRDLISDTKVFLNCFSEINLVRLSSHLMNIRRGFIIMRFALGHNESRWAYVLCTKISAFAVTRSGKSIVLLFKALSQRVGSLLNLDLKKNVWYYDKQSLKSTTCDFLISMT